MRTCNIARTACILLVTIAIGCVGTRGERKKSEVTMNDMSICSEEHAVSALAEEMNGKIKVKIDGAVFHPGEYIMDEGSSLGDLMDMAEVDLSDPWTGGAALQCVYVGRDIDGRRKKIRCNCKPGKEGRNFVLQNGDEVLVDRLL